GSVAGALFALTYDVEAGDLKASFLMEHYDRSLNTGFTLFDFDNDGVQEICYRDEKTLRIIKPTKPYVSISDNDPSVILFKEQCNSDTGFEYPVIADVDNDASAEICVLGTFNSAENVYEAFLFVLGNGSGDKFAPARKVWNQFMYDPFKIDDNLQTPIRPAIDRLQSSFNYRLVVRDENGDTVRVIDQYNPYNATINQAPYHNAINEGDRQLPIYNPIVFLTQAAIGWHNEDAPKLVFEDNKYYIEITVSNGEHARTDIATATPIAIYKNNKVTAANLIDKSPLSAWTNVATGTNISAPIKSGEKVRIRRLIGSAASLWDGIYIVRLGDDSGGTPWVWRWGLNSDRSGVPDDAKGIGIARRAYRDCAWDDQWVRVSRFLIYPDDDFATVQHYSTTMIDILANDVLLPPCDTITLTPDKLITPAGAGVLKGDFGEIRIVNNKLLYTAPSPSLHTGVVNISYVLEYPQENEYHRAEIYIYLVESCTETFSACSGQPYQVCLKENPAGVKFKWYDMNYASLGSTAPLIENPTANVSYYVKPDFSGVTTGNPWLVLKDKDFPTTKITVNVHSSAGDDTLRWTGVDDSDWFNPGNWVKVVNGKHLLTDEIPNSPCINVVLGEGSIYYPELTGDVNCSHIHLEDKTVFTGLQHLDYATASLEYQPETSEKGRFTMWSAPLKNMYTGDYHFPKEDTGLPHWGLVYMNFFQAANPDYAGSVAEEKAFTATFGDMDTQLPLGKAFNINILPNVEGKRFTFPKTFDRYTASNGTTQTGVLDRTNAARFITDGVMQANGTLELPVDDQYSLIQIVNPFAAYLKVNEFLALPANSAKLENAYKLWDGKLESGFVTLLTEGNSLRMVIADADKIPAETETLVEPFHSFFVMKKQGASFSKLTIKPEMLTTVAPTSKLVLRSAPAADKGVLRITARQQSNSNATVLRRQSGAVPAYDADEDSRKVFIDDVPLLVYSITDGGDALSINQSDDFTHNVRLGLRIRNLSQPVTLTFSEVQNFGRRVWLVDKETGRETDLLTQPEYTFTAKAGSTASELNDRFTLRFGEPTAADAVESGVRVYAAEGQIHIRALDGVLTGVEVFNVSGALVWRSNGGTAETSVAVAPDQVYLVRTAVNGKPCETKKIMVFN
ncbi:MAG: hypothetical protein LBR50_09980, partial [Tannerella sp.]|nr:hypothetical protein [Tannerella sp.]